MSYFIGDYKAFLYLTYINWWLSVKKKAADFVTQFCIVDF